MCCRGLFRLPSDSRGVFRVVGSAGHGMVPVLLGKARRRVVVASSLFAGAVIAMGAGWMQSPASAQSSSDSRAGNASGNVTTCAGVGLSSDVQIGSASNTSAGDARVQGTVKTNAGTTDPGEGQELDVAISGAGIVVDAIVVKGGPAYNLYTDPSVLPPALHPDQHYIAPFNRGGNVPTISHWFVCYHLGPSPTTTTTTTTTTVAPTTTTSSTPPDTRSVEGTTVPPTTTTVAAREVPRPAAKHGPKPSTTTQPTVTTTTKPRPPATAKIEATIAAHTVPNSGASTASFIVGCATAVLGLVVLALRSRL
jgi:hypothetical protein